LNTRCTQNRGKRNNNNNNNNNNNKKKKKKKKKKKQVRVAVRGRSFIIVGEGGMFTAVTGCRMYPLVLTVKVGWLQGAA
jgi:hypothetical protein